jgi:succinate dehydrogenase/fumarate reductase cytochrome b subunit
VVLPALVVLGLVTVVAIASTGSTPSGSDESRAPSESLLDTLFTLGLVAVLVGGVITVYGLMQRKAIAREVASGRYHRTSLVAFLAFFGVFMAFSYWRLQSWSPPQPDQEQELAFPGTTPEPTTPDTELQPPYEANISWLPIVAVVGLVVAATAAYVVAERRARRGRTSAVVLAEQLAVVLDDTLDDLRAESDPRRAIIAAYARLERVLAANGVPRRASETSDEYLPRVLDDLTLDARAVARLTALFTRAKFSRHDVDTAMKEEAISALEQVRDELRLARERPQDAPDAAPVGASS